MKAGFQSSPIGELLILSAKS